MSCRSSCKWSSPKYATRAPAHVCVNDSDHHAPLRRAPSQTMRWAAQEGDASADEPAARGARTRTRLVSHEPLSVAQGQVNLRDDRVATREPSMRNIDVMRSPEEARRSNRSSAVAAAASPVAARRVRKWRLYRRWPNADAPNADDAAAQQQQRQRQHQQQQRNSSSSSSCSSSSSSSGSSSSSSSSSRD